jgi:hypothetical protein
MRREDYQIYVQKYSFITKDRITIGSINILH